MASKRIGNVEVTPTRQRKFKLTPASHPPQKIHLRIPKCDVLATSGAAETGEGEKNVRRFELPLGKSASHRHHNIN